MKIKNSLTLALIFVFCLNNITAQRRKTKEADKTSQDKKKEPQKETKTESKTETQVFDNTDESKYFEKYVPPKNIISVNFIEPFEGAFTFHYERVINTRFSVELGYGITSTAPIFQVSSKILGSSDFNGFVQSKSGNTFRVGVRYYVAKKSLDAPEGPFIALGFQIQKFKFFANPSVSTSSGTTQLPLGIYQETTITNNDLVRLIGGVKNELNHNFAWEFYFGIGLRNKVYDGWYQDDFGIPAFGSKSEIKPAFITGVKACIGF
jgi:hypothetical protein